jgi:hypothetical protein
MVNDRKWKFWISLFFRILILEAIVLSILSQNYLGLFLSISTIFLTFLPSIIKKKWSVDIPNGFEVVMVIFLYASLILGEIHKYYDRFWWWDTMLHLFSGIIIGIFAFYLIYEMNKFEKIKLKLNPFFVALFAFCFALAIGAIWEIFEFTVDQTFNTNMQKGLHDTMWDLIADSVGALLVSTLGYFKIKKRLE